MINNNSSKETNNKVLRETKHNLIKVNIVVVVIFTILFSVFIYSYFRIATYNKIDNELYSDSKEFAMNLSNSGMYPASINVDPRNIIYIYNGDNLLFYTHNAYFDKADMNNKNSYKGIFTKEEHGYTFRGVKIKIDNYTVYVIRSIDSELAALNRLIVVFTIGFSVAIGGAYIVAVFLTNKALKRIEITWEKQARFIQDASHELRTPLTVVSSKLQSMLQNPNNTVSDEVENIADAMKETRRLRKMVSDLLSLTKEDGMIDLKIEKINIENFIKNLTSDYEELAQIQDKKFECNYDLKNKEIYSDESKLRQLLIILIDNAFKYTNENDFIKLNFSEENNNLKISVKDSGVGIKEKDIKFIFDRFFRSDDVRDKDIDGTGIGLSIAKMIVMHLNGKINVSSKENEVTNFEIILPLKSKKSII